MTELQEREYDVLNKVLSNIFTIIREIEEANEEMERELMQKVPEGISGEMERIVWQASDAERAIRGRLNELNEDYCVNNPDTYYSKRHARLARAAGINYVALDRVNYHDREDAIRYIEDNGLASLNYVATCVAVEKFEEIRRKEYWEKYHAAKDINTQALMLKVPYAELDAVIEYLRARGFAGHDMLSTCAGIEEYYAEKRTA